MLTCFYLLVEFLFFCVILLSLKKVEVSMSPTKTTQITLPNGEVVPVYPAESVLETEETKRLRESAAKAGANAIKKALSKGIPVTIMRDGVMIQINPDRTETVLEA